MASNCTELINDFIINNFSNYSNSKLRLIFSDLRDKRWGYDFHH